MLLIDFAAFVAMAAIKTSSRLCHSTTGVRLWPRTCSTAAADGRFSNRPAGVKRFETIHRQGIGVTPGARASLRNRHISPSIMGSENEVEHTMQTLVSLTDASNPARPHPRTSFLHQPEAQHPKPAAVHNTLADYPIFRGEADIDRFWRPGADIALKPAQGFKSNSLSSFATNWVSSARQRTRTSVPASATRIRRSVVGVDFGAIAVFKFPIGESFWVPSL
jgi:hypothetical protein